MHHTDMIPKTCTYILLAVDNILFESKARLQGHPEDPLLISMILDLGRNGNLLFIKVSAFAELNINSSMCSQGC